MSDTPETDAHWLSVREMDDGIKALEMRKRSQKIERERNQLREQIEIERAVASHCVNTMKP